MSEGGSNPPSEGNRESEGEQDVEISSSLTVKEILANIAKRKRTGKPMPSAVKRREELLKRRRLAKSSGDIVDPSSGDIDGTTGVLSNNDDQNDSANPGAPVTSGNGDESIGNGDALEAPSGPADAESEAQQGQGGGDPVVVAPQVRFDKDGNIVIDKESLFVSTALAPVGEDDRGGVVTVNSNDLSRRVTSASFSKRSKSTRWTEDDNLKFYQALSKYGTDFAMLELAFPGRNRKQIKMKFKKEERENLNRVNRFLKARTPMALDEVRRDLGLDVVASEVVAFVEKEGASSLGGNTSVPPSGAGDGAAPDVGDASKNSLGDSRDLTVGARPNTGIKDVGSYLLAETVAPAVSEVNEMSTSASPVTRDEAPEKGDGRRANVSNPGIRTCEEDSPASDRVEQLLRGQGLSDSPRAARESSFKDKALISPGPRDDANVVAGSRSVHIGAQVRASGENANIHLENSDSSSDDSDEDEEDPPAAIALSSAAPSAYTGAGFEDEEGAHMY